MASALATGTVLQQGAVNKGLIPVGGEKYLWTAAFVAREVILIAPRGMEREESTRYYADLAAFLVGFVFRYNAL